jgi:hypothetical protein
MNFEKETYTTKADIALAQINVGETELAKRIYGRCGLILGEKQEERIKQRENENQKKNLQKKTPEAKGKRVKMREKWTKISTMGINQTIFYKRRADETVQCNCKGELNRFMPNEKM